MKITLKDGSLCCAFQYGARRVEMIKSLPERSFDPAAKTWSVPVAGFERLAALFGAEAEIAPGVLEAVFPAAAPGKAAALPVLRDYAHAGVTFTEAAGGLQITGPGVSPVLRSYWEGRADIVLSLLRDGEVFAAGVSADTGALGFATTSRQAREFALRAEALSLFGGTTAAGEWWEITEKTAGQIAEAIDAGAREAAEALGLFAQRLDDEAEKLAPIVKGMKAALVQAAKKAAMTKWRRGGANRGGWEE